MSDPATKQKNAKFEQQETAALARIEELDEADKLFTLMTNARRMGSERVAEAAFRKRVEVLTGDEDEHEDAITVDFWRAIHTLEAVLTEKNGKSTRLTPTRQKFNRAGVLKTLSDLSTAAKPSEGFALIMARDMPDLTVEAVVLRYPDAFDEKVRDAATARLAEAEDAKAAETMEEVTDG